MKKVWYIGFILLTACFVGLMFSPRRSDSPYPVEAFGKLPVLDGGRYKPIDSLARTSMLLLRGKQSALNPDGEKIPATEWLMHVVLSPETASGYPVFRIDHQDVKEKIGVEDLDRKYFSYAEVKPHIEAIDEQVRHIPQEAARRDAAQRETMKLYNNLMLYRQLCFSYRVPLMQETVEGEYLRYVETLKEAASLLSENPSVGADDPVLARVNSYTRIFSGLSDNRAPKFVPTLPETGSWLNLGEAMMNAIRAGELPMVAIKFAQLSDAYAAGNPDLTRAILAEITQYYEAAADHYPAGKVKSEYRFNQMQPFTASMELYLLTLLGVLIAWLAMDERFLRWVFWILLAALLIHSMGMIARMIIQGRPPVTNLYSSAVFVGWGSVALGVILERIYRNGLGAAVSSMTGFISLVIASHLMASGDTMEMMRAVLDSNFWLSTHVVTVSMGYASTYLAGFLAFLYFLLGILTRKLDSKTEIALVRMVYGIVCFSLLFSFIGTVLGGIWADQSWGRFWGWDPKENGALMIVIWNALILHAKRSGMVRNIGFMNLAIFGNVVTSWSWFGTNMLGVGLHSYGFMDAAFWWLIGFCLSQVAVMMIGGWLPKTAWRSKKA